MYICVCVWVHAWVEVREQLWGVSSLLLLCGPQELNSAVRLSDKCVHPLRCLTRTSKAIFVFPNGGVLFDGTVTLLIAVLLHWIVLVPSRVDWSIGFWRNLESGWQACLLTVSHRRCVLSASCWLSSLEIISTEFFSLVKVYFPLVRGGLESARLLPRDLSLHWWFLMLTEPPGFWREDCIERDFGEEWNDVGRPVGRSRQGLMTADWSWWSSRCRGGEKWPVLFVFWRVR